MQHHTSNLRLAGVLLSAVLIFASCSRKGFPKGWRVFSPESKAFSVMMPASPTHETAPVSVSGIEISLKNDKLVGEFMVDKVQHVYKAKHDGNEFSVVYEDLGGIPNAPRELLNHVVDQMKDGLISAVYKLKSAKDIEFQGSPGIETVSEARWLGWSLRKRIFVVGTKLFQLIVIVEEGDPDEELIAAYFDSFKLHGE